MGDTSFAVTHAAWLKTETDRLEAIILMPRLWGRKWTHARLKRELHDIGLDYSLAEIAEINGELHTRGIVEDVVIAEPLPEPV